MEWPITRLGGQAITYPGQKDYARTAIQEMSLTAAEHHVYTHTGWRNVGTQWLYLHAAGAIGGRGAVRDVNVRLAGPISLFDLGDGRGSETLQSAINASLRLCEIGPPGICFPLLASGYRAVLGGADFSVHLAGATGAFKTEMVTLIQRHFGRGMDRLHLPGSWSSTPNALEALAFHAKDTVLVVDDFAPQGSATDVQRYHAAAERVFRAVGNRAGRGRMDSGARLREPKPPRCLVLSTGEEIPRGHSVRARLLILEIAKGAIEPGALTACQRDAADGLYVVAMFGFIRWIAERYEEVQTVLQTRLEQLRYQALDHAAHARTPGIVASLQAGFEIFIRYATDSGALDAVRAQLLADRCWAALGMAATEQAKYQVATEPAPRYVDLIRSLLSSGHAHLDAQCGGEPDGDPGACGWRRTAAGHWQPLGDCIGWVNADSIYLEPAAAYRAVQLAGRDRGETLEVSEQTLRKRLSEKGLLASVDPSRGTLTIRRRICGTSKDVLHFLRMTILPDGAEEEG